MAHQRVPGMSILYVPGAIQAASMPPAFSTSAKATARIGEHTVRMLFAVDTGVQGLFRRLSGCPVRYMENVDTWTDEPRFGRNRLPG